MATRRCQNVTTSQKQRLLMMLIGSFDAAAYVSFCTGFTMCGASLSNILLSSMGQIFTALSTRFILGKRLSYGQLAAITLVGLGIVLRSPALESAFTIVNFRLSSFPDLSNLFKRIVGTISATEQAAGVFFIILAAALYSCLGITYEALMSSNSPPPYQDILFTTSAIGSLGAVCYQIVWVLPRWGYMVAANLSRTNLSHPKLVFLLILFGALFNLHMYIQSRVFKSDGAIGVGLVNAVRGAVLVVATSILFCSERSDLCLTFRSGISALLTTLGGVAWVLVGPQSQGRKSKKAEKPVDKKE
jgi:uncharacterized membrane protein (DUF373 family)